MTFFLVPRWTLWYLVSLITWKLALFALRLIVKSIRTIFILSIVVSVIVPFLPLPTTVLSLLRSMSLFPFFVFGVCLQDFDLTIIRNKRLRIVSLCLMILLFVSCCHVHVDLRWLINWNSLYQLMPLPIIVAPIVRIATICTCLLLALAFLSLVPDNNTFLQEQGKNSLFYYMWHPVILTVWFSIRSSLLEVNILDCVVVAILVIVLICEMNRVFFLRFITNPLGNIKFTNRK